jgi:hypothetical protein
MPNGNLKYEMQDGETGGNRRIIDAANMIHVPLMSFDGIVGLSPIMQAAPALGLAAATEKFGSRLFTNYATPMRQTWELLWSVAIYRGCSFGFRTNKDSWKNENGVLIRTLEAIEVMELSLTAQPAYLKRLLSSEAVHTVCVSCWLVLWMTMTTMMSAIAIVTNALQVIASIAMILIAMTQIAIMVKLRTLYRSVEIEYSTSHRTATITYLP